jgi:hypothetical protein
MSRVKWIDEGGNFPFVSELTDFYRRPSATSDLARHAALARGLSAGADSLGEIVRGLLIHNVEVKKRCLAGCDVRQRETAGVGRAAGHPGQ